MTRTFRAKASAPAWRPSRAGLIVLLLAASSCHRSDRGPAPTASVDVVLAGAAAPRSPEGARVEARLRVDVAAAADGQPSMPRDEAVAAASREAVEAAIRTRGVEHAGEGLETELRQSLRRRGWDLVTAEVDRIGVAGMEREESLAPTTDVRILLVGLDGFDWDIAEPLMAKGRMPALTSMVARGTKARLSSIVPILSPVIWTSMATGREPQDHGILDFLGQDAKGNAVPVTSNLRRTKAFWNVLSEAGVSVGVVGWWATWPAEPVNGFLVSDRVAYQLFEVDADEIPSAGKVFPPALWDEVAPLIVRPRDITAADLAPYFDPSTKPPDAQDQDLARQFAGVVAQARTYSSVALRLHPQRAPRVGAYYFESPDTTCHLFMRYAPPPLPEIDATRQLRFAHVVERSYEFHDRLLSRLVALADEKTVVIVVSDHGFRSGASRLSRDSRVEAPTAAEWHERQGVLALAGPGIRQGHVLDEASVLDVFPTMLALLGMPLAEDLAGRVLEGALDESFLREHPIRRVASFETPGAPAREVELPQASAEDRAIIESLVAIGYVSAGTAAPAGSSASSAQGGGAVASANAHNNMGMVLSRQGEHEAAVEEYRKALDLAPDLAIARINLAHALLSTDRRAECEAELRKVLAMDAANGRALSLLAGLELEKGHAKEAERLARDAVAADPRSTSAWFATGTVLERQGRVAESRDAFAKAAELDPDNPEPLNALGNSHEAAGEWAEAADWYRRALAVDRTFAGGYNNLALQLQRLGQLDEALATYEEGLKRLPGSSILLNNLASWHHASAQRAFRAASASPPGEAADRLRAEAVEAARKARGMYEEAIAANPMDASPVNNLGALLGDLGDAEGQLREYRRALEVDPRHADAHHNVGLWHFNRQQWGEAHEAFRAALAIHGDDATTLAFDAMSLAHLGRGREGVAGIDAALRRRRTPQLLAAAGNVHEALGDRTSACARYRESLALDPRQPDIRARITATCSP